MWDLIERTYFTACLALGKLLRAGRYSKTRIIGDDGGAREVRKHRMFYAPLLIWMGAGLMKLLDTGVRVLPRREWMERERRVYELLYGTSVDQVDPVDPANAADSALLLPWLPGDTLASLLEDARIAEPVRQSIIERAVVALAGFHRLGLTHGDAMAENVMIDVDAGVARWFDFETVHESDRLHESSRSSRPSSTPTPTPAPTPWQRADDLRALLATCLIRTAPGKRAETVQLILDVYADDEVARLTADAFSVILKRPLTFHLGQAPLPIRSYREIARLLRDATRGGPLPSDRSRPPGAPAPGMRRLPRRGAGPSR